MPPLLRDSSSSSSSSGMPQARLHYVDSASCNSANNSSCRGRVKCVLVGDGAVGKTSLIVSYTTNGYPIEYVPTAFDNYNVVVNVDNQPIMLQLCDTAGQDDFDSLRPLCYPGTDVYIVCFSVVSPTSFGNVTSRWLPEIRHHSPAAQIILVGTQSDLRSDVKVLIELARYREKPVSELEAQKLAHRIGAETYIECSALTQQNLKDVFDQAILVAMRSCDELRRLTAGRSKGSRLLASFHNWRGSFASDRGGLLRSSRRSKSSKDGAESSSSSSSNIQQHAVKKSYSQDERKPRFWQRLCCMT